jgi:hypothetical protein
MTLDQIDRSGDVWKYRPAKHKTAHQGKERDPLRSERPRCAGRVPGGSCVGTERTDLLSAPGA